MVWFCKKIFELSGLTKDLTLVPIPTIEYPTPAARPRYSLLANKKLKQIYHQEMPHWQDALRECLIASQKGFAPKLVEIRT